MADSSLSAVNGARAAAADFAGAGTFYTLGLGEGAVPFGTTLSDAFPPENGQQRYALGWGQLTGSVAAFGEAGGIAAAGGAAALTVVGIPAAVAAEFAAAGVAIGGIVNAGVGLYNIARGDPNDGGSGGGSGGGGEKESLDPAETAVYRGGSSMQARPIDVKTTSTGMVKPTRGLSLSTNPNGLERFGGARQIRSIPDGLKIVQQGRPGHYELVAAREMSMAEYQDLLNQVTFH